MTTSEMNTTKANDNIPCQPAIRPNENGMPYPSMKVPDSTVKNTNDVSDKSLNDKVATLCRSLRYRTYIILIHNMIIMTGRFDMNTRNILYIMPSENTFSLSNARINIRKRKIATTVTISQTTRTDHPCSAAGCRL